MSALKGAVPATPAAQPVHSAIPPRAGTLAGKHGRQRGAKIVYLISVTSREPEVGIPEEMQQGRKKYLLGSLWPSTVSSTCI